MMRDTFGTPYSRGPSWRVPNSPDPSYIHGTTEYPKFDEFFESLGDRVVDQDLGSILGILTDAKVYCIHELMWYTDSELKDLGLAIGDIKWLRSEVKRVITGGINK
jgi:hypothetical protein